MTAHVVKLTAETYPITSASWIMSLNGGAAQGPGNKKPFPVIHAHQTDTITYTVVPNPHGVKFAPNAFCAVAGTNKPTPPQACSADFAQNSNPHVLVVTDNVSAPGPAPYYYTIKFTADASGHAVGPVDPIIIHEVGVVLPGGTASWSTATIVGVAAVALVLFLVGVFAWRRLRA